jgi:hypothetical protein
MADGGWNVEFDTNELNADQLKDLGTMKPLAGKLIFATPDVKVEPDVSDVPVEKGDKTPSQRLRSRMFVYYSETHKDDKGFNSWYENQLDTIGQGYLDRLN